MNSAPRLGIVIVTNERPWAPEYQSYSQLLVQRAVQAGTASGWCVDLVAAGRLGTAETLRRTREAEALVVLGGEDIAPEFYGGARGYRAEGVHVERADEAQIAVVQRAARQGTPLLGVCRGHQIINVALGGSLLQDLGEGSEHRRENVPVHRTMSTHDVHIAAGSRLAGRLGATVSTQSAHHQAVDALGSGLRAVATASDGLVEAIEHGALPITGVQWHPEDPGAPRTQLPALLAALRPAVRASARHPKAA
ncbi:MAG: gamma-glutamyl-gamma-aminobutyrate hydrolase family protein [Herbiconiux sp.]|nr:gamma-glutamyl-gamma-aminobutyrate hydrolase family protein [Herbiconiux sp.]